MQMKSWTAFKNHYLMHLPFPRQGAAGPYHRTLQPQTWVNSGGIEQSRRATVSKNPCLDAVSMVFFECYLLQSTILRPIPWGSDWQKPGPKITQTSLYPGKREKKKPKTKQPRYMRSRGAEMGPQEEIFYLGQNLPLVCYYLTLQL